MLFVMVRVFAKQLLFNVQLHLKVFQPALPEAFVKHRRVVQELRLEVSAMLRQGMIHITIVPLITIIVPAITRSGRTETVTDQAYAILVGCRRAARHIPVGHVKQQGVVREQVFAFHNISGAVTRAPIAIQLVIIATEVVLAYPYQMVNKMVQIVQIRIIVAMGEDHVLHQLKRLAFKIMPHILHVLVCVLLKELESVMASMTMVLVVR